VLLIGHLPQRRSWPGARALTLSLCAAFLSELIHVEGVRLVVNGGLNKVRFPASAPVGARVRGSATLARARDCPTVPEWSCR
jgi:acyl dehydratase